jgi:15-cis-phytoene synthase
MGHAIASDVVHPDVIAMARDGEPERYLAATLSPAPTRSALIALAAFSADLRRIPHVVKEPMMGEVRLQWWRDCISSVEAGEPTGHPIADALATAVRAHSLPVLSLIAMTEARAFDLYDDPMPDETTFASYLSKTEAIPFALAQQVLGGSDTPLLSDLAARSFGHVRLFATLPAMIAKGRMPLPVVLLDRYNIDPEALLAGRMETGMWDLLQQSCREITTAQTAARRALRTAKPADRLALLPLATVPSYVTAILRPGRDPVRTPADISPLARVMRLGRARWLGL